MDLDDNISFNEKDDEIKYWKEKAHAISEELQNVKKDAEEFENESRQLEKEYDIQLSENEKRIKELNIACSKAHLEIESLRAKLDSCYKENNRLETEVEDLSKQKMDLNTCIRVLEQKNDDLERSRRIVEETLHGIEVAFNSAIEKNAILESEMDEKENLKEKLQRLVDETRDLKQELLVKEREKLPDNDKNLNCFKSVVDTNKLKETETQTTPLKRDPNEKLISPLVPGSRVMAINLVGDLIRKIGGLEHNLDLPRSDYRDLQKKKSVSTSRNGHTSSLQRVPK